MSFVFRDDERIVRKNLRPGEYRIGRVYDERSEKNLIYLRDENGNSTLIQETENLSPVSRFREGVQGSVKITYTEEGSIRLYRSKDSSNPVGAYVFKFDPNKFLERAFGNGEEFIPPEVFVGVIELPEEGSGKGYELPKGHGAKIFVYSPRIAVSEDGSKYYGSITAFVGTVIS